MYTLRNDVLCVYLNGDYDDIIVELAPCGENDTAESLMETAEKELSEILDYKYRNNGDCGIYIYREADHALEENAVDENIEIESYIELVKVVKENGEVEKFDVDYRLDV